jgi:uncharacterized RDD family membrane protein YckC
MTYYYAVNGQQAGPVSEEELRSMVASGSIPAETPIWCEGMADWQPFSVTLGGGATAAPTGATPVVCAVCHQTFPADQTIRYGNVNVCGGCKPRFVQGLREGAVAPGQLELAGIGSRIVAKILDSIIVGIVNMGINFAIMGTLTYSPSTNPNQTAAMSLGLLVNVINFAVNMAYNAGFLHWRGQTLGKMAMNIKVVTPEGAPLSWGKSIGRPLAEILSGCACAIGYIISFWDPEKRTLHDRLAGTRVIKANK